MNSLKTREWLFILLIVILIQFIIQGAAWLYGGNSGALGYISFAGTAVSIILAVLAIMYSFLQSTSQEKSSANISTQVSKLIDVVQNIELSKDALSGTLDQLSGVTKKLDVSIEHQGYLRKEVNHLSKSLKGFGRSKTGYTTSDGSVYAKPFKSGFNGLSIMVVFVYYAEMLNISAPRVSDKLIMPVLNDIGAMDEENQEQLDAYNTGAFMTAYQLLNAIGCIELDKSHTISLHPDFKKECEKFLAYASDEDSDIEPMVQQILKGCAKFSENAQSKE